MTPGKYQVYQVPERIRTKEGHIFLFLIYKKESYLPFCLNLWIRSYNKSSSFSLESLF